MLTLHVLCVNCSMFLWYQVRDKSSTKESHHKAQQQYFLVSSYLQLQRLETHWALPAALRPLHDALKVIPVSADIVQKQVVQIKA